MVYDASLVGDVYLGNSFYYDFICDKVTQLSKNCLFTGLMKRVVVIN